MHILSLTIIDHTIVLAYEQRQHEIEAKEEFKDEFCKLQNDFGKLYGILLDQCNSGMKNQIHSDPVYYVENVRLDAIALLTIIERIYLSNDSSKHYALLQARLAQTPTIDSIDPFKP